MIRPTRVTALLFACISAPALAELRVPYEDATVAQRAHLIVVGRLQRDSIKQVRHQKKPGEGASWEHHATLIISEVLHGHESNSELPIVIHYGLTPKTRQVAKQSTNNPREGETSRPSSRIEIFDTASLGVSMAVKDAGTNNLWFLRKRIRRLGDEQERGRYGIIDPEDLQPLSLKEYFKTYLTKDAEAAVREFVRESPEFGKRTQAYFDHQEISRILADKDVRQRVARLLPYYRRRTTWNLKPEARTGLVQCGKVAGDRLKEVFDDPAYEKLRQDIILVWRDMNYVDALPLLIDLLKRHNRFWATQKLERDWWNDNGPENRRRKEIYGEVYYAVAAMRKFGDPRAEEALRMTYLRWEAINFENDQIIEECVAALKAIANK